MKADFAAVRSLFPGAKVVASDLDTYMDGLASQKDKLTLVTGELAEGWIYGPLRHVSSNDLCSTLRFRLIGHCTHFFRLFLAHFTVKPFNRKRTVR